MPLLTKSKKLVRLLRYGPYRRALRFGVAAAIEHERLLSRLSCNTVVDIGANRGQFALVARRVFPLARIISFEPLKGPAQQYRQVFARDARVSLHEHALGSEAGAHVMHIASRDDSSSLLPITDVQTDLYPDTVESRTESVPVERLDDVLSVDEIVRPSLLKLDIQGYELEALKGAEQLLLHFDYVYSECAFCELYAGQALADSVIAFLAARGFQLRGVYNAGYSREGFAVQADILFSAASAEVSGERVGASAVNSDALLT